jgi:putative nucleotidyltransferase with HDIG domain
MPAASATDVLVVVGEPVAIAPAIPGRDGTAGPRPADPVGDTAGRRDVPARFERDRAEHRRPEAQLRPARTPPSPPTHRAPPKDVIESLVGRMTHLPGMPAVYREIVAAQRNPETPIQAIGDIVGRDPVMTARLLKLVNSAFFGLRCHIDSPADAAHYLGVETLRALVLTLHAFAHLRPPVIGGFSCAALWSHSLEVAALAKALALSEGASRRLADEAFVAGLLHDAGKVVLAANFPDCYAEVERRIAASDVEAHAMEREVFGASHAEVGGYVIGDWSLPVPVLDAITHHHHPGRAADLAFSPLTAVHVADRLVRRSGGADPAGRERQPDEAYLAGLGLSARLPAWRQLAERRTGNVETR